MQLTCMWRFKKTHSVFFLDGDLKHTADEDSQQSRHIQGGGERKGEASQCVCALKWMIKATLYFKTILEKL